MCITSHHKAKEMTNNKRRQIILSRVYLDIKSQTKQKNCKFIIKNKLIKTERERVANHSPTLVTYLLRVGLRTGTFITEHAAMKAASCKIVKYEKAYSDN
jgi:hypothetical protein